MKGKLIMTDKKDGWVVINIGHPNTGTRYIVNDTFSFTRRDAIKSFTKDSGYKWEYWKRKYNFRCERAILNIECYPKNN